MYDIGRPAPDGRLRPHLDLRRRASHADPRQGPGPDRHLGVLVRADRPICRNHVVSYTDVPEEASGRRCSSTSSRCSRSSASCAATSPARAGRTTRRTGAVCGIELPDGLQESEQLPEPIFTPATKADVGDHDENVTSTARRDPRRPAAARGAAPALDRALQVRRRRTRARAGSSWPTRSSSSAAPRRRDRPRRRGAHARLVAVLAGRRLRAGHGQPSFDKQFVRDWASGPAGTRRRRRPRSPTRSSTAPAQRYEEAYERITGEPFSAWLQQERRPLRARVLIRPKEGSSIHRARQSNGRCPRSASTASATCGSAAWSSSTCTTSPRSRRCARSSSPIR